jgi:hypothetical protein
LRALQTLEKCDLRVEVSGPDKETAEELSSWIHPKNPEKKGLARVRVKLQVFNLGK